MRVFDIKFLIVSNQNNFSRTISGEASGCGGMLNASIASVSFRSPDADNDGKYDAYLDCQWLAVGADYQVLDLTFSTMALEGNRRAGSTDPNDECPYDYLEVRFCKFLVEPKIYACI